MHVDTAMNVHAHTQSYTHKQTHTHTHGCRHTPMNVHAHTRTHTCTHADTHALIIQVLTQAFSSLITSKAYHCLRYRLHNPSDGLCSAMFWLVLLGKRPIILKGNTGGLFYVASKSDPVECRSGEFENFRLEKHANMCNLFSWCNLMSSGYIRNLMSSGYIRNLMCSGYIRNHGMKGGLKLTLALWTIQLLFKNKLMMKVMVWW